MRFNVKSIKICIAGEDIPLNSLVNIEINTGVHVEEVPEVFMVRPIKDITKEVNEANFYSGPLAIPWDNESSDPVKCIEGFLKGG